MSPLGDILKLKIILNLPESVATLTAFSAMASTQMILSTHWLNQKKKFCVVPLIWLVHSVEKKFNLFLDN